jgi:hypothetical protein
MTEKYNKYMRIVCQIPDTVNFSCKERTADFESEQSSGFLAFGCGIIIVGALAIVSLKSARKPQKLHVNLFRNQRTTRKTQISGAFQQLSRGLSGEA